MRYENQAKLMIKIRGDYDLTQRMIAEETGLVSSQFISNIERGIAPISIEVANAILRLCPRLPKQDIVDAFLKDVSNRFKKDLKR